MEKGSDHSRGDFGYRMAFQKILGLVLLVVLCSACGKKNSNNNNGPGGGAPPPPNGGPPIIYPPGSNGGPAGTINGVLQGDSSCSAGNLIVRVMVGNQSVYEIPVPFNGTFSFQVAGNQSYTLRVDGNNNCYAQQILFVPSSQNVQVTLNLSKTGWWGGGSWGGGGGWGAPYPPPGYTPYTPPYIYGNLPCYWNQYGCHGNYYPGWCGAVFGKPMVYIDGPSGATFEVAAGFKRVDGQPELDSQHYVLSPAVPMQGPSAGRAWANWNGKILTKPKSDRSFFEVGKAHYSHLIYDVGVDTTQSTAADGVLLGCKKPANAISLMVGHLYSKGFKKNEISDFKQFWDKKSFPNEKVCVYTLTTTKINDFVELQAKVNGTPVTSIKRVWFLVQMGTLQEVSKDRQAKLNLQPPQFVLPGNNSKSFIGEAASEKLVAMGNLKNFDNSSGAQRSLSSVSPFEIREWGVGFLIERAKGNHQSSK